MRKSDLQFIRDTQEMEILCRNPMNRFAQEIDPDLGVFDKIKSYVHSLIGDIYDPKEKAASAVSFLTPSILTMLGFPFIAIFYELAQAFGFDWTHFFSSLRDKLTGYVNELATGKQGDTSVVNDAVASAATEAMGDKINPEQLQQVVEKSGTYQSLNNMLFMKKIAASPSWISKIVDMVGSPFGGRARKGILGFIIRFMSWIVVAVLIAAGFALLGGTASKLMGIKRDEPAKPGQATTVSDTSPSTPMQLNTGADSTLFTTTFNDDSHTWMLNMNINDIKDNFIKWAQELYPQLNDKQAFESTPQFNNTIQMFRDRNKGSPELEILAVPQPFRSIREIVDSFASYVADHTKSNNKPPIVLT